MHFPCRAVINSEYIEIGNKSGDTFVDVVRGLEGSSAISHNQDDYISNFYTAEVHNEGDGNFAERKHAHSGLEFAYYGGRYLINGKPKSLLTGNITLEDNETNYIFINTVLGNIETNIIRPDAMIPLFAVVTDSGNINTVIDERNGFTAPQPVMIVVDEKEGNGGTFTGYTDMTRDLNTIRINQILGASLDNNQITLPAGEYLIYASAPAHLVAQHVAWLESIDETVRTVLLLGSSEYTWRESWVQTFSLIQGKFVLSVETDLEIRHWCLHTRANNGFGVGNSRHSKNIWTQVKITRTGDAD